MQGITEEAYEEEELNNNQLFDNMVEEFNLLR